MLEIKKINCSIIDSDINILENFGQNNREEITEVIK